MRTDRTARLDQIILELHHLMRAVESLICNIYHLSRATGRKRDELPFVVVTDRSSIKYALRACMLVGAVPWVLVRVVGSYDEAVRFTSSGGSGAKEAGGTLVVSRLVYARYYTVFQPLRSAGRVIVV